MDENHQADFSLECGLTADGNVLVMNVVNEKQRSSKT